MACRRTTRSPLIDPNSVEGGVRGLNEFHHNSINRGKVALPDKSECTSTLLLRNIVREMVKGGNSRNYRLLLCTVLLQE